MNLQSTEVRLLHFITLSVLFWIFSLPDLAFLSELIFSTQIIKDSQKILPRGNLVFQSFMGYGLILRIDSCYVSHSHFISFTSSHLIWCHLIFTISSHGPLRPFPSTFSHAHSFSHRDNDTQHSAYCAIDSSTIHHPLFPRDLLSQTPLCRPWSLTLTPRCSSKTNHQQRPKSPYRKLPTYPNEIIRIYP